MLKNGNLQHFKLTDIINILTQSGKSGKLNITSVKTNATLFFSGGKLIHAESSDNHTGEEVLLELVNSKSGNFLFEEEEISANQTINKNLDELLNEASLYTELTELLEKKNIAKDTNAILIFKNNHNQRLSESEINLLNQIHDAKEITINRLFLSSGKIIEDFVNSVNKLYQNKNIEVIKTEKELLWNNFQNIVNAYCDEFISISGHKMSADFEKKIQDLISTNAWSLIFKDGRIYSDELFSFPVSEQWKIYVIFLKEMKDYFDKIYGGSFSDKISGKLLEANPELRIFIDKIKKDVN